MRRAPRTTLLIVLAGLALADVASAQDNAGFALNRYDPAERGSDWFAVESLDLRGHLRPFAGLTMDWGYKPLVIYDGEGDEVSPIVEHQLFGHVGGGLQLWDRVRFAVNFPVAIWTAGEGGVVDGVAYTTAEGFNIGDLRLGADVRIVGEYGEPFTLAGGVQVHVPTGDPDYFAGDGGVRIVPRAMVAGRASLFTYAVRLNVNIHTNTDNYADAAYGTELGWAAAVGLSLVDHKLVVGPELIGSTVVSDGGDGFFGQDETPLELLAGAHYKFDCGVRIGAAVGPGLTRGLGSPILRTLATVEWVLPYEEEEQEVEPPPPPPPDSDGDGIIDDEDACPEQAGPPSPDPSKHGCPPPPDADGDGIPDAEDACPQEHGPASSDPAKHGCPPPGDRDGDGIVDEKDACPDEVGVASDDPEKHGCPPPKDSDGDGIVDEQDACPNKPGLANADPKKHGCPKAIVVGKMIKILDRVEFASSSAVLRPASTPVLQAVLKVLEDNPQIKKVSVEGHTDNRGGRNYNILLSKNRAASVVRWLVKRGIDKKRLTSQGFGPDKPIDVNTTPEGRQNNRRVEFHIRK